ncbi:metalloenzyme domain-containing protein [Actinosynnema sp. ALI-1.44]|uniref:STM4013/SEN3800 family hydrolase n=1 Tax=Actinosynnema sp. ALI-1.44 TaxID=1933779 RepID=UPI00097CA9D8|nr:STM4013/SEN3800 family hydrolase [Actinosynnema sp. ALI-1.44]ONI86417.1 metalloenzyme domain-containing protein [Actinosynnema sp. ALI-1.44]
MSKVDMNAVVGSHDLVMITLDTLRYDVAQSLAEQGRTPVLAGLIPGGRWERRHAPGSFTFASHAAMFAGFLPTPASQGPHSRLFAARFSGSESTADGTWVYDAPDMVGGLANAGYHTVCLGGVGFFTNQGALGSVLPGMFAESHWSPEFGVTAPHSTRSQVDKAREIIAGQPRDQRLFLFLNVSALHQPNWFHLSGASAADGDTLASHAAALEYVDAELARLFDALRRPSFVIVCSDHGTAYGEDGYTGHRLGHEVVWTVPYAQFVVEDST